MRGTSDESPVAPWGETTLSFYDDIVSQYASVLSHSSDIVFITDTHHAIVWVSPAVTEVLGWEPEDIANVPFSSLIHTEDTESFVSALPSSPVEKSHSLSFADSVLLRLLRKNDTPLWMMGKYRSLPTEMTKEGTATFIAGWHNVTDLVEARFSAEVEQERLKAVFNSMMNPHVMLNAVRDDHGEVVDFTYSDPNDAACLYMGMSKEELSGTSMLSLLPGVKDIGLFNYYVETVEGETALLVLSDYEYPNEMFGIDRRYNIRAARVGDALSFTWQDITDNFWEAKRLKESELRYKTLVENMSDVVLQVDEEGKVVWVSESITNVLGWEREQVFEWVREGLIHPEDHTASLEHQENATEEVTIGEYRILCSDGSWRWMIGTVHHIDTEDGVHRVISLRDIQNEIETRLKLEYSASHDPLTGLKNRTEILKTTEECLLETEDTNSYVGVLCLDIDSLAKVNDALTHKGGDAVIANVARLLLENAWDKDMLGRGAGDEFYIVLPSLTEQIHAGDIAERYREAVKVPFELEQHVFTPTVSVGISTGRYGDDAEILLRDANLAMRQAKDNGRDRCSFVNASLADEAQRILALEESIRHGLEQDEFKPWFMPIICFSTGEIVGYEALIRWVKAYGSIGLPETFLSVAEKNSVVTTMDFLVLQKSLEALTRLPDPLYITANFSAKTLALTDCASRAISLIQEKGISPERVRLEITETSLLTVGEDILRTVEKLSEFGVRWYVDDFGTGYSSISHLRDLPIAGLKLDTSFVAGIAVADQRSIQVAKGLAGLAHGLELDTVAEGIETAEQAQLLYQQGWASGQGYYYGKAKPLHFD